MQKRLYTINTLKTHHIFTGKVHQGEKQVLIVDSILREMIIGIVFDTEGNLLNSNEYPYADSNSSIATKNQINTTIQMMGLLDFNHIRVKKFWINGHMIGVHDYPLRLQYLLNEMELSSEQLALINKTPKHFSKEQSTEMKAENWDFLMHWRKANNFVFWAGHNTNYWADSNGIHST